MTGTELRGLVVFRTLFFSPVVVSLVAWTIVWSFLLQNNGGINGFLQMLGITGPNWLRTPNTAMISVIVVQVFKNVGLNMILFLAALQGVPKELYEAARVDGAPAWKQFRRITVPMISPTILLTSIITIVGSLQPFAQQYWNSAYIAALVTLGTMIFSSSGCSAKGYRRHRVKPSPYAPISPMCICSTGRAGGSIEAWNVSSALSPPRPFRGEGWGEG